MEYLAVHVQAARCGACVWYMAPRNCALQSISVAAGKAGTFNIKATLRRGPPAVIHRANTRYVANKAYIHAAVRYIASVSSSSSKNWIQPAAAKLAGFF